MRESSNAPQGCAEKDCNMELNRIVYSKIWEEKKMNAKQLTAAETIVMKCIWDADHEMSLAEIVKNANEGYGKEWKPQTVSTYLAKLCLKNYIQMKRAGRTITYEILITEEDYKSEQAREFVAFWNNGSLKQFITAFYKDEPASKDEIEELRNAIEELEE